MSITVEQVLAALSDRLETLEARLIPGAHAHGYEDERYNGRPLIALNVRPQLQGLVDRDEDPFEQELPIMHSLETDTGEAICWDEGEFVEHAGPYTEGVHLIDLEQLDVLMAAIGRYPVITAARRAEVLDEYRVS